MNISRIKHILRGHLAITANASLIDNAAQAIMNEYMNEQIGRPVDPDECPFDRECVLRNNDGTCGHPEHSTSCNY